MTDIVSIELLLDPAIEALVRADWDRLEAAGLSSLAAHRSPSNRPHITLLARPTLAPCAFGDAVDRLPIPVALGAAVVFPHADGADRGVLARPVIMTEELRMLHGAVHAAASSDKPGDDAPFTAPGAWTPHVTLARRLLLRRLPDALALLGPELTGTAITLRRWDSATKTVTDLGHRGAQHPLDEESR